MTKRFLLIIMVFCFLFISFRPAAADDLLENEPVIGYQNEDKAVTVSEKPPEIEAIAGIVMDMETGRILYEKNAYTRRAMASTTKIMTALLAIEKGKLDDIVTVSKKADSIWGSELGLREGDKYTLKELLLGMLISSGNDAAIAVAEHIGGTLENFLELMNARAIELGARDTSFKSPHGLDAADHYSTAYDLAVITRYALKNEIFSSIVGTRSAQIPGISLYNTNELLDLYPGADGVKTGYTGQAGRCLVASATREGRRLISVVLNCPTRSARARSSKSILDYSFNNYKPYVLVGAGEEVGSLEVRKGIKAEIPLKSAEEIKLPMRQDEIESLVREYSFPKAMEAPVKGNLPVGTVKFMLGDKEIASTTILTGMQSLRKDFHYYINRILKNWVRLVKI